MKLHYLFGVMLTAGAAVCAAAVASSPDVAAIPLPLGGPSCVEQMSGPVPAGAPAPVALPGAGGAPVVAGGPSCTGLMAGPVAAAAAPVPMALPGPLPGAGGPPVPPGAPVLPAAPVVPAAPAAGAPVASAPLLQEVGAGKGVPTNPGPALTAFPQILPGPPPAPAPGPTLTSALGPLPSGCNH